MIKKFYRVYNTNGGYEEYETLEEVLKSNLPITRITHVTYGIWYEESIGEMWEEMIEEEIKFPLIKNGGKKIITLINLTPHEIKIVGEDGKIKQIFPPSGGVARVETEQKVVGEIEGIPIVKTELLKIAGLPEQKPGVVYIVSALVAKAAKGRNDVIAPDTSPQSVVRDDDGRIFAVKRFQIFV